MAENVHSTPVVIYFIWAIQLLLMQYLALDTFNPLCCVKYLALNSPSCDTWLMKRNNLAKHSGFSWLLLPDWYGRGVKSATLMITMSARCQMNTQHLEYYGMCTFYLTDYLEFVFGGHNGNLLFQDSNLLRFCNLVTPRSQN